MLVNAHLGQKDEKLDYLKVEIFFFLTNVVYTVFPGSSDPFYIVSYYIKWVTTSWTYSKINYKTEIYTQKGKFLPI